MTKGHWKRRAVVLVALLLATVFFGTSYAQVSTDVRREAARLERLSNNVWDSILDDLSFGYSWDQRIQLDLFNFVNGTRYLNQKIESGRTPQKELGNIVELLLLQSQAADRSLRVARAGRYLMRDWDEAKTSLDYLARALVPGRDPYAGRADTAALKDNINNLQIEIKEVRSTGNFFSSDYRIRGVISGRNIASAGIYHEGRLVRSLSVRLQERKFIENPFEARIEGREGTFTIRVIDNRGFTLEQPIEFTSGGFIPGFK